jgi:ankyrin repeat protein
MTHVAMTSAGGSLLRAVGDNDLQAVTDLLRSGCDVNQRSPLPYTPLMIAAGAGFVQMTDLLIGAGADVHAVDSTLGGSALHKAAQSGTVDVARLLLDHGAFINFQSATVGHTPLIDAAWAKRPSMVKFLLERGAAVNIKTHYGGTVWDFIGDEICWTAGFTNPEQESWGRAIRILLEGAQQYEDDTVNAQALMRAVQANDAGEVKHLLADGVDVNERSPVIGGPNDGQTPLLVACFSGSAAIVAELLAAGANPLVVDYLLKATPLHKAAFAGHADCAKLLVDDGVVELNAQGPYNGYTALHDSVWHGHADVAEVLLAAGVRTDLRGFDGRTPLDLAVDNGYEEIAALLREKAMATSATL